MDVLNSQCGTAITKQYQNRFGVRLNAVTAIALPSRIYVAGLWLLTRCGHCPPPERVGAHCVARMVISYPRENCQDAIVIIDY